MLSPPIVQQHLLWLWPGDPVHVRAHFSELEPSAGYFPGTVEDEEPGGSNHGPCLSGTGVQGISSSFFPSEKKDMGVRQMGIKTLI